MLKKLKLWIGRYEAVGHNKISWVDVSSKTNRTVRTCIITYWINSRSKTEATFEYSSFDTALYRDVSIIDHSWYVNVILPWLHKTDMFATNDLDELIRRIVNLLHATEGRKVDPPVGGNVVKFPKSE